MNTARRDSVSANQGGKSPYAWRKMFQFRIRTLLIAMLILPIGLGWIAKRYHESQIAWSHYHAVQKYINPAYSAPSQTRQTSWISRLGFDSPPAFEHLSLKFGLEDDRKKIFEHVAYFESLTSLSVTCIEISKEDMLLFQRLKGLQKLELHGDHIDQDGINEVAKLTNLRSFGLDLPRRRNKARVVCDLSFLAKMPLLESLRLELGTPIGNKGLEAISKAQGLKRLRLRSVTSYYANGSPYAKDLFQNGQLREDDLADEGLLHLAKIPHLESLHLYKTNFTGKGMQAIGKLTKLEGLAIDSQLLDDEDLQHLRQLKNLKALNLECPQLSGQCLPHVVSLPCLRSLLMVVRSVASEDLSQICKVTNLQLLELHDVQTNDDFVQAIKSMPELLSLSLDSANLTDENLLQLVEVPKLDTLFIIDSLVTPAGETAARKMKPNLVITIAVRSSDIMSGGY